MVIALIAVNVAIFVFQTFLSPVALGTFETLFGLSLEGLQAGFWWQFFTHAFLHANWLHLLFNMLGLWFAGRIVERVIGSWRFLLLYVFSAVSGGVFQMVLNGGGHLLLGASGAVCGVILAFTTMFPNVEIFVLLFFIIPLRLRAKYLGWGLIASSLLFQILGFQTWIGHAAHLGGCVAGALFARLSGFARPSALELWVQSRFRRLFH